MIESPPWRGYVRGCRSYGAQAPHSTPPRSNKTLGKQYTNKNGEIITPRYGDL